MNDFACGTDSPPATEQSGDRRWLPHPTGTCTTESMSLKISHRIRFFSAKGGYLSENP